MTALAALRWHLWSYGADTGTFTQIAFNAFAGFSDTSERGSHFHVHWSPILVVLAPFARLTHAGLSLQIVQELVMGASVFPLYRWLRPYAGDGLAATLALLALAYPPMLAVAFDEFHEIAFEPVLVFGLLLAIDSGRRVAAIALAALLLLVREEALIVFAVFGLALAFAGARRRRTEPRGLLFFEPRDRRFAVSLGAGIAVSSTLVFATYFAYVAPAFGGWTASHFYAYPFANGPREIVLAAFREPWTVARAIATPGRLTYLIEAFAPLAFLPLRSRWIAVAAPGFAIVMLSSDASTWRMGSHYAGVWIPWLLAGAAERVIAMSRSAATRSGRPDVARRALRFAWAGCAIELAFFDPLHPAHYLRPPYADLADARLALASVPPQASLFTHDEWYARIAGERPRSEHVWAEPEYAVLASDFPNPARFAPFVALQVRRGCYAVERRFGNVVVYRRAPDALAAPRCRIAR